MAVTASVYGKCPQNMALGNMVTWNTNTNFKIMLVGASYTFDRDAHELYSSTGVSTNELTTANGYTVDTKTFSGNTCSADYDTSTDRTRLKVTSPGTTAWTAGAGQTLTAYGAIVYRAATTKFLLCYINFGAAMSATNDNLTITWDSTDGVMYFTVS